MSYNFNHVFVIFAVSAVLGSCGNENPFGDANDFPDDSSEDSTTDSNLNPTDSTDDSGSGDSVGEDEVDPPDGTTTDMSSDGGDPVEWACVPDPGGTEICDNGYDDDCDDFVDEVCGCAPQGTVQGCYPGDPAHLTVASGHCRAGTQTCGLEFWSICSGAIGPVEEVCGDNVDNNCDGTIDEGCGGDPPIAVCPSDFSGPVLSRYTVRGEYDTVRDNPADPIEPMTRSTWSVRAPPGHSYDLEYSDDGLAVDFFADVVGDYNFVLTVWNQFGEDSCETVFTAESSDVIRVEMFWNRDDPCTAGNDEQPNLNDCSDIDLYLHSAPEDGDDWRYYRKTRRTASEVAADPWGRRAWPNPNVCNWQNCATCQEPYNDDRDREIECRGFVQEQIDACELGDICPAPSRDIDWGEEGSNDDDPRLDLDDVEGQGPENINLRHPEPGTYRIGVHFWKPDTSPGCEDFETSRVWVNILCGGRTVFDTCSDEPAGIVMHGSSNPEAGDFWEIGELSVDYDDEGIPQCSFSEFGSVGSRSICRMALDSEDPGESSDCGCDVNMSDSGTCP